MATETGTTTEFAQSSSTVRYVALVVAAFAVVGVGMGLTGYWGMSWLEGQLVGSSQSEMANAFGQMFVALVFVQSAFIALFTGPTVATLAGLTTGTSLRDGRQAAFVGGAGAFVGFFVMVVLAIGIMAAGFSTGSGGDGGQSTIDAGEILGEMWKAGVPTALAGALAGYVGTRF